MIRRAFQPVTRLLLAVLIPMGSFVAFCPDDYTPRSYEAASDELSDFLEEYFTEANLTLPPTPKERRRLGLQELKPGLWLHPQARKRSGRESYPFRPGIWKIEEPGGGRTIVHLLLREPSRLSENEAFNILNDRLGDPFADYDNPAYGMILLPEGVRRHWGDRFLEISAQIYGVYLDATGLDRTVIDVILTDDTPWVRKAQACKENDETAAAGR